MRIFIINVIRSTFMVRSYAYEYDAHIIELLLTGEQTLWTRKIKEKLDEKFGKCISFETIDYHINNLIENEYVVYTNHSIKRGQKKYIKISKKALEEHRLGILRIVRKNERRFNLGDNIEERKKQSYYIILCVLAFYQKLRGYGTDNHYPRDFFETMALLPLTLNHPWEAKCPGLTVMDLLEPMRGIFGYWHLIIDEFTMNSALDALKSEKLIEEIVYDKQSYFVLSNNRIKDFIFDCTKFYPLIQFRLNIEWNTLNRPKPNEMAYFEIFHTKMTRNEKITHFQDIYKNNKSRKDRTSSIADNRLIVDSLDNEIDEHHNLLLIKYSDIFNKHLVLANTILDVFYPIFLRDEVKNIATRYPLRYKNRKGERKIKKDKNGNNEYKKFPKVIQSFSYDEL